MKSILFAPALLAALALTGSVAFAASTSHAQPAKSWLGNVKAVATSNSGERCVALQSQFDSEITTHETAKKAAAAKKLRHSGGQLCAAGKTHDGIKKLEQALADIGVKPNKASN